MFFVDKLKRVIKPDRGGRAALRAKIDPAQPLEAGQCRYGDIMKLKVRITNTGESALDSSRGDYPDFLSYHWVSPGGEILVRDGLRTPLGAPLAPGESRIVTMRVSAPVSAEEAVLSVDIVREGRAWFSELGLVPLRVPFSIELPEGKPLIDDGGYGTDLRESGKTGTAAVEEFWGQRAESRQQGEMLGWLDHPVVQSKCVLPKLGGEEGNWLLLTMERHGVGKGGDWLDIGCGDGGFDLWVAEQVGANSIEGIDVSPKAIEIANLTAKERGFERAGFRVLNLNEEDLPAEAYDTIIASMSIHHIENIEEAFDKIHRALRPGGFFIANEYVGPNRFNFPKKQLDMANELIALLPAELRLDRVASRIQGRLIYKDRYVWRSPEHWLEVDPSEAVRSEDIIPVFERAFDEHYVHEYGGTLLHLVLENIVANFDSGDQKDRAIIRLFDLLESSLIEAGVLRSDFAVLVGRRR